MYNENVMNNNALEKRVSSNTHTQYAHHTCPILFSWDALFYHAFFVSLYLLVFRLFFTFLFAFIFAQQWYVQKMWGWLPIVAFNSDLETFTKMNSYAVVVTAIIVTSLFVLQIFARHDSQREYKVYAWYLGVVMLLMQYMILLYINSLVRFAINTDLWWIFIGIIIFATALLYLWTRFIRQIRFRQFYTKELKNLKS
jgi:hypothetical protein